MKDSSISYDLVPHHHQQPQQQQQASWSHQRQLQTHTTSIYSNHNQHLHQASQSNSHSRQQQQQQTHEAHMRQYSHQLQSAAVAAHHNNATAYYQQTAHLYPTYHAQDQQSQQQQQTQQQQSMTDHHGHHHHGTSVTASNSVSTSALNAAVNAAQQHPAGNAQSSALDHHAGWSPAGVGAMAAVAASGGHHAVVSDHSNLAYMAHAYQSHGTSAVNDHHRNSSNALANQTIGSAASTYTVDTLYSTPAAAAAAVAAYGYNNYNPAFFQTSTNGHHAQTGHPSPAGLSTFWNPTTQQQQQRTTHSQSVSSQATASLQQRQIASDHQSANNYLHDPRLYGYSRPPYAQNTSQSFSPHHQTDVTQQPQHHRMSANLSQQHSLITQHHQQDHNQSQLTQQSTNQASTTTGQHANLLTNAAQATQQQQEAVESRKLQTGVRNPPQQQPNPQQQMQASSSDVDAGATKSDNDHRHKQIGSQTKVPTQQKGDDIDKRSNMQSNKEISHSSNHLNPSAGPLSSINKTPSVIKTEQQNAPSQPRETNVGSGSATSGMQQTVQGTRSVYRAPHEDRIKSQAIDAPVKKYTNDRTDPRSESKPNVTPATRPQEQVAPREHVSSLEDSMATLSLTTRKTTWASIASQPAKVSAPKSLKSKMTGNNSVLSSTNKHLTSSVTMDSSNHDSKNGINPAIKNSVSTAATSLSRPSAPPPVSKMPSTIASIKLDLLGEDEADAKISWPAVNASIKLTLEDTVPQKSAPTATASTDTHKTNSSTGSERPRKDDGFSNSRDYNHNQGLNSKFINNYMPRDDRRQDDWQRRDMREYRTRRDSDRRADDIDKRPPPMDQHEDLRDHLNARRDFKPPMRTGPPNFRRQDSPQLFRDRDFKRPSGGPMIDRNDHRNNDGYRFPPQNRGGGGFDNHRDMNHPGRQGPVNDRQHTHHHYNNLREPRKDRPADKLDLTVYPHLDPKNFNPGNFDLEPANARFFIIKSYSEDDVHRSIKYSVWCSTPQGNERLDEAYRQQQARNGQLFLFFSVNGSGHFCGMAQMTSKVDFDSSTGIWAQDKWQGEFNVKWIYVKDVPNMKLRHITLENNDNKAVTNSRDTQEVPYEKGKAVLKIIHQYKHDTSLFDDFLHYERRQEEEKAKKSSNMDSHHPHAPVGPPPNQRDHDRERFSGGANMGGGRFGSRPHMSGIRPHNDFPHRDRPTRYS